MARRSRSINVFGRPLLSTRVPAAAAQVALAALAVVALDRPILLSMDERENPRCRRVVRVERSSGEEDDDELSPP